MPKKIVKTIELFRFTELSEKAKERAVQAEIKFCMDTYDNTPEKVYSGETIATLGFDIDSSPIEWSGIDWVEYDFVWDDYKLSWKGSYAWEPEWRTKYAEAPYYGPEDKPALLELGERLEALQIKHDYKLRAEMSHHSNTYYYGCDFHDIHFVDEGGEEIEDIYESWENPNYEAEWTAWKERLSSTPYMSTNWATEVRQELDANQPKQFLSKTTQNPLNADLPEFVEILKALAAWWRRQLQEHWEGEQDEKYVASVLADYNDRWFYENGVEADEEPDDDEDTD